MCIFKKFVFLCGCDKLKIFRACNRTSINAQREVYCQDDPHAHIDDSVERTYAYPAAHGPGVCSNIHCRWKLGLMPLGVYREGKNSLKENDAEFDMSEQARVEREDRWFRTLSTDQQLECLSKTFPMPADAMSLYAQANFNPDPNEGLNVFFAHSYDLSAEHLRWYELNPRYMTAEQLHHATGSLLPAEVTLPGRRQVYGSTPHKPLEGPFKVGAHVCKPVPGICLRCGRNAGDPKLRTAMIEYELDAFMSCREHPVRPSHSDAHFEKVLQKADDIQQNPDKYVWDEELQTHRLKPAVPAGAMSASLPMRCKDFADYGDHCDFNMGVEPTKDDMNMEIDLDL